MEDWYSLVRQMKDYSDEPNEVEDVTHYFFQILTYRRIRDMRKFEQRLGAEYESILNDLYDLFSENIVNDVILDDEFFDSTLSLTQMVRGGKRIGLKTK
jgi:hypothetical protein